MPDYLDEIRKSHRSALWSASDVQRDGLVRQTRVDIARPISRTVRYDGV